MNSIVVYGSRTGNTQKVAAAIAGVLRQRGGVRLLPAEDAAAAVPHPGDLLVVGGPTEGHTMTPAVREYLDAAGANGLRGVAAAAFDTRVDWPRWLSGSAAAAIATRLRRLGASVIVPEGSFIVTMKGPALEPGELERAAAWAAALADAATAALAPRATAGGTAR
ncbi:MAG: flavodoxin family protein [Chloroflexi bacterium]|nr:MAG: flavodoxin family protein [Chloroflexota bacterium]